MALEPTGISLEAKGLSAYINALDKVNKSQQEVFNATAAKTGKSYKEVEQAAKGYANELNRLEQAQRKAAQDAEKLAQAQVKAAEKARKAQIKAANDVIKARKKAADEAKKIAAAEKTATATRRAAFVSVAQAALQTAKQIASVAVELAKLGATAEAQGTGLNNLAASFGQSGSAIQRAITSASKGTISDIDAMRVANEALLLGVARTPEEFDKFIRAALTLGRTVGLSASESITKFTTALGRESLLRLDDFGAKASEVNAEIERLAQSRLGKLPDQLTKAEKSAIFIEASLNVTGDSMQRIGEDAATASEEFDRLSAASENFKTQVGLALSDLNQTLGITKGITSQLNEVTKGIKLFRGIDATATIDEQIEATEIAIADLQKTLENVESREEPFLVSLLGLGASEETNLKTIDALGERIGGLQSRLEALNLQKAAEDAKKFNDANAGTPPIIEDNTEAIKAYASAIKQAEDLQLSFARAAEDAALKLARANEDIARKQAKAVADLEGKQKKAREKLLDDQIKQLADFEKDREKQIAKAEKDVQKARKEASEKRKRDQEKLHRDLKREQERFNLSQLQSERRFKLSESRLRAEGDILALKELREDRALERQEEKENFDLSKKEQIDSAKEQQREQQRDLEDKVKELKEGLEEQRAELLASFDEQLQAQQEAQAEATALQQQKFADDKVERDIALAREEEDRRISQRRQLEDLGRSLTEQKDITAEGVNSIAEEIEKVFGMEGVANNIIVGFSKRTRSEFSDLLEDVKNNFKQLQDSAQKQAKTTPLVALTGDITTKGKPPEVVPIPKVGIPAFQHGGVVDGPLGSPQIIKAHAGETVLPTHNPTFNRQMLSDTDSFRNVRMTAPVIPSQNLNVSMSGGFDIKGGQSAGKEAVSTAIDEMTESFRIAIDRLARRN